MRYLDFDLSIERTPGGYCVRVFNSPAGQASGEFTLPFSDLELENFLLRVGRSRQVVRRRVESSELGSAKAFGGRLFESVFAGDVRGCFRSSVDDARRQDHGLRVRLHLGKAPELADLPWEYLYNASLNRFLSLSLETPVVRYLDFAEAIRPIAVEPPLQVLQMIASPSDYPQLDVGREAAKMQEALADLERRGLVHVERQQDATLAGLQRRLRTCTCHIFHFVGHGGFDRAAEDGFLLLEDERNRARAVGAQYIGALLRDHRPLRLAILNACEGARGSISDPFAGTAQSLVQQGIPAVIAMQFEVSDEAAIRFTHEFYGALSSGYPVDASLTEARKAIFADVSELEWGTPVLYMRAPDARIFDMRPSQVFDGEAVSSVRAARDLPRGQRGSEPADAPSGSSAAVRPRGPLSWSRFMRPWRAVLFGLPVATALAFVFAMRGSRGQREDQNTSAFAAHEARSLRDDHEKGMREARAPASSAHAAPTTFRDPSAPAQRPEFEEPASSAKQVGADQPAPAAADRAFASGEEPETDQLRVQRALARAAEAESRAFATLDPRPLEQVYTGDLLQAYKARLKELAAQGQYEVHTLREQRIEGVRRFADGRVRARFAETWQATLFNRDTGACIANYPDYTVSQTAWLRESADVAWRIYALDTASPAPRAKPCP